MDKFKINLAFLIIAFIYSCSGTPVTDFSKQLSSFASDFYLECNNEQPGNVIVSPLSVSTALALLMQGAKGSTLEQLAQELHLSSDKSTAANGFLEHREVLEQNMGKAKFSIVNRIYVQQGYQFNAHFEEVAVAKFKSGVESLNFAEAEKSAETINHFVSEQTNGKIKDVVKSDQLDPKTRSVLVNAIYFKADWKQRFSSSDTRKSDFYNSGTDKVSVDFMYMDTGFDFANLEDLDAQVLEMKYAESNASFGIILPNQRTGLTTLETRFKDYDFTKITDKLRETRVEVKIPKFRIEYEIELNDVLENMGITEIFSNGANLRDLLNSDEQLTISRVIHKAFIEVTERGTEAGASTVMIAVPYSMPPQFIAEHPFMFYIRETQTNTILFNGRVNKL